MIFFSTTESLSSTFKNTKYFAETKSVSSGNYYVSNCLFHVCWSSEGGGIFVTSSSNFLIEETTFLSCSATSGKGGGLFFEATGNCVLSKVCSFSCSASSSGLFCYVKLPNSLEYNNTIIDSSVSHSNCPNSGNGFFPSYGKIFVSSVNSSKNIGSCHVGIRVDLSSSSEYGDSLISYSCFSDIETKNYVTVLYGLGGKGEMRSCNVVNNTQIDVSRFGTVCSNFHLNVYDSCVTGNNAERSFHCNDATIKLYNTIFDKGILSVEVKESASSSFTNNLKFIRIGLCGAKDENIITLSGRTKNVCSRVHQGYNSFQNRILHLIE